MKLKKADEVSTATLIAAGLIGGWLTARESGIRPLGTIPLVAAGALAARSWNRKKGPAVTVALLTTYVGAFGLSHPLAKKDRRVAIGHHRIRYSSIRGLFCI